MARYPGFVGPSNRQRSLSVDTERSVNWYVEIAGAGTPAAVSALYPTPGLALFTYLGSGAVRGLFAQDGRCFGVGGAFFYELLASGNTRTIGNVRVDGRPVTISSNGTAGHQLFVTSGGRGYIYDLAADSFTQITDENFPANVASGLFFDQYFVALDADTGAFSLSDLDDGLVWSGLDINQESQFSDKVIGMQRVHDNLWLFGSRHTGPYYNGGDANNPFLPVPSALIEHGTAAPFSAVAMDNTVIWLGQDEQGTGLVWKANGYTPARISTHAVEYALGQAQNLTQAVAYSYQEQGHLFYVLYVPGLETTWVYDVATDLWHERAHWDTRTMRFIPHVGVNHCFAFGRHLVGDRRSGAVYTQSLSIATDTVVAA